MLVISEFAVMMMMMMTTTMMVVVVMMIRKGNTSDPDSNIIYGSNSKVTITKSNKP